MEITLIHVAAMMALAQILSIALYVELLFRHRRAKCCIIRLRNERDHLRGRLWRAELVLE